MQGIDSFFNPAVRRLAWLAQAPQLISGPNVFHPSEFLRAEHLDTLKLWDAKPEQAPAILSAPPRRRLGLYFEDLYQCLMTDLFAWTLLAKNFPVRSEGRMLGELDFVFHNPHSGEVEHHEIAVKFYLGVNQAEHHGSRWFGPKATDRLDIKTSHLLNHQSQLSTREPCRHALLDAGIQQPMRARVFMPGYLFYPPFDRAFAPDHVPKSHARGLWFYSGEVARHYTTNCVELKKPHWLGPWQQKEATNPSDFNAACENIEADGRPRLFAKMQFDAQTKLWHEEKRFFVVPPSWPTV